MEKFELYTDKAGDFRWRLKAKNGEIIADSNESYRAKHDAERGIELVKELAVVATVDDLTSEE